MSFSPTPLDMEALLREMIKRALELRSPPTLPSRPQPIAIEEALDEPLIDVFEGEDEVKVYVELKGVKPEKLRLNLVDGSLEVKAEGFHDVIQLPRGLDVEAASSRLNNGVLEVKVPKLRGGERHRL